MPGKTPAQPPARRPEGPRSEAATLGYWHARWAEERQSRVSGPRLEADEGRWRKYVAPTFSPDHAVGAISRSDLDAWVGSLQKEAGIYTVEASVMALRQVLDRAVAAGMIPTNPAKGLVVAAPTGIEPIQPEALLSNEQFERIVQAAGADYGPLIRAAGELGCPWKQAIAIRVRDVNFEGREIELGGHEIVETNGTIEYVDYPSADVRTVPVSQDLSTALVDLITATEDRRSRGNDWIFLTPRDHVHPLRSNFNRHIWRPALTKAGVDPRAFTFHDLRHFAAAQWLRSGVPIEEVSRRLGHLHLRTTQSMYGGLLPSTNAGTNA